MHDRTTTFQSGRGDISACVVQSTHRGVPTGWPCHRTIETGGEGNIFRQIPDRPIDTRGADTLWSSPPTDFNPARARAHAHVHVHAKEGGAFVSIVRSRPAGRARRRRAALTAARPATTAYEARRGIAARTRDPAVCTVCDGGGGGGERLRANTSASRRGDGGGADYRVRQPTRDGRANTHAP